MSTPSQSIRTLASPASAILFMAALSLPARATGDEDRCHEEAKLTAGDALPNADGDLFGASVSLSGNIGIVGAHWDDDAGLNAGAAHVFERDSSGRWTEVAKLIPSDASTNDFFGVAVSLSGGTALIGAYCDDDGADCGGAAYVYQRDATGRWGEVAKLIASDTEPSDSVGLAVALSGSVALAGSPASDHAGNASGAVWVFERDVLGRWNETAKLVSSQARRGDEFGDSVAVSGSVALVGVPFGGVLGSGSAHVYERDASGQWNEVSVLTASDGEYNNQFGRSVSILGDLAIVGAPEDDDLGDRSGSAYVYERDGAGAWHEVAKLTASDGAPWAIHGNAVSMSDRIAVVGARWEAEHGHSAGAAYVYERDASGNWTELTKLTASDATANDQYGTSVSVSGGDVLIGASFDGDVAPHGGSAYIVACAPVGCGDPCDLTSLLLPLLPKAPALPSTHPCFEAEPPADPTLEACEGLSLLTQVVPGVSLSSQHPCFSVAAPDAPSEACCETIRAVVPMLPASLQLPSTHPCLTP